MKICKETMTWQFYVKVDFLTFYDIGLKRHVSLPLKYWDWNGDTEKPTIRQSILIEDDMGNKSHLFIKDGKLIYLRDCTHDLKNKTVDMVDI